MKKVFRTQLAQLSGLFHYRHCSFIRSYKPGALRPVADLGGGMHPPHQPKPNDFGRKISLNFGEDLFFFFFETI